MRVRKHFLYACQAFLLCWYPAVAHSSVQQDTVYHDDVQDTKQIHRLIGVTALGTTCYTSNIVCLSTLWYKDYDRSKFHFFRDGQGWMQIDKAGHLTTAYQLSKLNYQAYKWTGVHKNKAILIGTSMSIAYLSCVEYLDGKSTEWGASPGDLAANLTGAILFSTQEIIFKRQIINLKWSYHNTPYAQYSPEKLGHSLKERWLKDYNGQTYWLSINVSSILPRSLSIPKFLAISLGYGANGMLSYSTNPTTINGISIPPFDRYRQYYLSFDIDLSLIHTKSKAINTIFSTLNFIKIPFPTLEYNSLGKFTLHPLYF